MISCRLEIDQKALKPIYDCNTAFVIAFILTKIDFQLLWRYFLGQIKVYQLYCLLEPYIYTKEKPLYHRINTSIFHNVSARVFSLYDPTIGFDSI
jgi:hypothetical protein